LSTFLGNWITSSIFFSSRAKCFNLQPKVLIEPPARTSNSLANRPTQVIGPGSTPGPAAPVLRRLGPLLRRPAPPRSPSLPGRRILGPWFALLRVTGTRVRVPRCRLPAARCSPSTSRNTWTSLLRGHCLDFGLNLNPRLVNCQRFPGRVFFNLEDLAGHIPEKVQTRVASLLPPPIIKCSVSGLSRFENLEFSTQV
jgi:hypothetical protein